MDLANGAAHWNFLIPSGFKVANMDRVGQGLVDLGSSVLTSGTLRLIAVPLPGGVALTKAAFLSGATAAVTPTNQWAVLLNSSRAQVALSADLTTTAWAANSVQTFTWTSYTPPKSGLYYVGLCVVAATVPSVQGVSDVNNAAALLATAVSGNSSTGLTNPASCPATPGAPTGTNAGSKPYVVLG